MVVLVEHLQMFLLMIWGQVLSALVERAGVNKDDISETILGQVLVSGQGQNPARQAHINAGLPIESAYLGY